MRIQYKCLVPIYVFIEMKLCVWPCYFQNRIIMFCLPISTNVSVSDLYIPTIGLLRTDGGNIYFAHRNMNVEIGNKAAQ